MNKTILYGIFSLLLACPAILLGLDQAQKGMKDSKKKTLVQEKLKPGERPALRFLEEKRKEKWPQHQNKLKNKKIRHPKEFEVEYTLRGKAKVAITITNQAGIPVRRFEIPPGYEGAKAGQNRVILWDGRDDLGKEAPPGKYRVFQEIKYETTKQDKERRFFAIRKKGEGEQ